MLNENFVIFAIVLNLFGASTYFIDTLKGKVKPNKVTWFLWSVIPFIGFAAEITQGVGIQSLLTFVIGFNPLVIFLASFINKQSQWKITKLDLICAALSACGLTLWLITRVGNIAIIFSILADFSAALPTIIKSIHSPETENYKVFFFGGIGGVITLLTIQKWNLAEFGFPLYIFTINLFLTAIIKFHLGKKFVLINEPKQID